MARLVFDLDGTLVDSAPTLAAAGNALLAELGRPPIPLATVTGFVGDGMAVLVQRLLRHSGGVPGGDSAPHVARFRALYGADPLTGTRPYPQVREALDRLAAAGHGLGVCTQKADAPALAILQGLGLMPPITGFAGGDSLGVLKPDPRLFWHAADQLAGGPALLVGDSEIDAATAQAAGVPFLLHARGYRRGPVAGTPWASFEDFAALPDLIARVLEARAPA